jgi:small subunit ribosomal protein S3|tara:strand:- start:94 stop:753 length:660 start_codon:yes stop_codon:yes gene_type:complete
VGQKTHPTGFRIGINKPYSSTWFANYGVYSKVLQEDYQIRQFFEKEWSAVYNKAGITKLEIKRKVNQIELLFHATRPKLIATGSEDALSIDNVILKLKSRLNDFKKIRIKVIQIAKSETESLLVARSLADQLEKRVAFRKAMRQISQRLQKSGVKGFKIQVSGRLNGAEIARAEWVREGRVPLQTIRADISYATYEALTTYGILGIKVWIFDKEIIPSN